MAVALEEEEVQRVTCRLVENIVETCGEEWRQCHGQEDVRRMKDMHVESLLSKNRGAVVDIEQCNTVKQFRSRQIIYHDEPEGCTDEKFVKSQTEFQTCTHSITSSVNDDIQSLNRLKSISSILCEAISSVSSDCVEHLKKCLDAEDVIIMSENHIEQLKVYFVKLAGDKVDTDFSLDNCQDVSEQEEAGDKYTSNYLDDKYMDEYTNIEETKDTNEIQESKDNGNDYVMDEQYTSSGSETGSDVPNIKFIDKAENTIENMHKFEETDYVMDEQQDNKGPVEDETIQHVSQPIIDISGASSSTKLNLTIIYLPIFFVIIQSL